MHYSSLQARFTTSFESDSYPLAAIETVALSWIVRLWVRRC